jgi:hypothetical protein
MANSNNFLVDDFDAFFSSMKNADEFCFQNRKDENERPQIDDFLRFTDSERSQAWSFSESNAAPAE